MSCRRALRIERRGPTKRAVEAYRVVEAFMAENGYPPSYEEIAIRMGIHTISTVQRYMERLEEAGWIEREYMGKRKIWLVGPEG